MDLFVQTSLGYWGLDAVMMMMNWCTRGCGADAVERVKAALMVAIHSELNTSRRTNFKGDAREMGKYYISVQFPEKDR